MRILVVGGGGREHAIVKALERDGSEIYSAMRNRNPGIARASEDLLLVKETETTKVADFALRSKVELAVIGPEAPLEVGLVDMLRIKGGTVRRTDPGCGQDRDLQELCQRGYAQASRAWEPRFPFIR